MGLDSSIIKVSKAKALATYTSMSARLSPQWGQNIHPEQLVKIPVGQPISLVPGWCQGRNEIGYWRNWRELNAWMGELAREKVPTMTKDSWTDARLSGAPILLDAHDIERLRFEVTFGDLWQKHLDRVVWGARESETTGAYVTNKLYESLNKASRVVRRGASMVFYVGSF